MVNQEKKAVYLSEQEQLLLACKLAKLINGEEVKLETEKEIKTFKNIFQCLCD